MVSRNNREIEQIIRNSISNNFFQKFRKAFQQRNWAIRVGRRVIVFIGFKDDDHKSLTLKQWVIREIENRIEEG